MTPSRFLFLTLHIRVRLWRKLRLACASTRGSAEPPLSEASKRICSIEHSLPLRKEKRWLAIVFFCVQLRARLEFRQFSASFLFLDRVCETAREEREWQNHGHARDYFFGLFFFFFFFPRELTLPVCMAIRLRETVMVFSGSALVSLLLERTRISDEEDESTREFSVCVCVIVIARDDGKCSCPVQDRFLTAARSPTSLSIDLSLFSTACRSLSLI